MLIFPQVNGAVAVFAGPVGGDLAPMARDGAAGPATTAPVSVPEGNAPRTEDVRLVIEQDDLTGIFVYKTVDRATGDIIKQYPRDQLLEIGRHVNYKLGSAISMFA